MFPKMQIKAKCLKAFLHKELEVAQEKTILNQCVQIFDEGEDVQLLRKNGIAILKFFEQDNSTKKDLINIAGDDLHIFSKYYNQIHESICNATMKFEKAKIGLNWIPLYFCLTLGKKSVDYGMPILPENINIDEMIKIFTSANNISYDLKSAYWKVARQILDDIERL